MYGKHFASTYTGSLIGAGCNVFAVWGYVIANTVKGRVELNPKLLAMVLGSTEEEMCAAIEYLLSPDSSSRSTDCEGRRLVKEGQFQYRVPTHATYRAILNEDERREYNRIKQAEHRAKKKGRTGSKAVKEVINDGQSLSSVSAHTEAEAEAEAEAERDRSAAPSLRKSIHMELAEKLGAYWNEVVDPGDDTVHAAADRLVHVLTSATGQTYDELHLAIERYAPAYKVAVGKKREQMKWWIQERRYLFYLRPDYKQPDKIKSTDEVWRQVKAERERLAEERANAATPEQIQQRVQEARAKMQGSE